MFKLMEFFTKNSMHCHLISLFENKFMFFYIRTLTNSNGKRSRNILAIRAPPVNVFKSDSFKCVPCNAVSKASCNSCVNLKQIISLKIYYLRFIITQQVLLYPK